MSYDDPCGDCGHARDMHTPFCQILSHVDTLTAGPVPTRCECEWFREMLDLTPLREAMRVSYSHAATCVCMDSGVALDSMEVIATPSPSSPMRCRYCRGSVCYTKYWRGETPKEQH